MEMMTANKEGHPLSMCFYFMVHLDVGHYVILMDLSPYSQSLAAQCTKHALQYECRDIQYYYVAREPHFNKEVQ